MSLRRAGKKALRALFEAAQKAGFDVLPRHFYSEIPDVGELRREKGWRRAYSMAGVAGGDPAGQLAFVREICRASAPPPGFYEDACRLNGAPGYGPVEADFLFRFARWAKPSRIVQVGCGVSTAVLLSALEGAGTKIECVEPYPTAFLERAASDGKIELVRAKAEDVPLERFASLGAGGLLFVDSTHALRPGGEVPRLVLEALPRLAPGAWAHFHDVYFPYDYSRGILDEDLFFPHESVLLHAFLSQNARWEVKASLSQLHYAEPAGLSECLPGYRPSANDDGLRAGPGDFPSSTYIRAIQ